MIKRFVAFSAFAVILILCIGISIFCQDGKGNDPGKSGKKGTTPPPAKKPPENKTPSGGGKQHPKQTPKNNTTTPPRQTPNQSSNSSASNDCAESELLIRCGLPECNVLVDGKSQGITNLNGELQIVVTRGKRNVVVSKNGYETAPRIVNVSCRELETVEVNLRSKPFDLQLRTNLSDCDILINDVFKGKTDEKGFFKYRIESGTVYVQARKTGYLTDSKSVSPAMAQKEISLKLTPLKARIILSSDVKDAFAYTEGDEKKYDLTEPILLEPGRRKLTVKALGYAPVTLEFDLQPDKKIEKTLNLERLPIAELLKQAETFSEKESFPEAIRLCDFVFESEPNNATANRLAGMIYLGKKDYGKAEPYLQKALAGNETIELKIRRHYNEKFDLKSGHGTACEGLLKLNKNEIEYRGFSSAVENFKVPYSQIQIIGLQLKKDVAQSLSLKVGDVKGNKKDYNFFGRDKELTQYEKPYLEMIQRIIKQRNS